MRTVRRAYTAMVGRGLPPAIRETFLLAADEGTMAIATLWRSEEDPDVVGSSPEEPFARRSAPRGRWQPAGRVLRRRCRGAGGSVMDEWSPRAFRIQIDYTAGRDAVCFKDTISELL